MAQRKQMLLLHVPTSKMPVFSARAADRAVRLTQRRSNVPSHKNRGRCFLTPRTPYTRQEREARFRRIALSYVQYNFTVYRL